MLRGSEMLRKLLGALSCILIVTGRLLFLITAVVTVAAVGLGLAFPNPAPQRVVSPPPYQVLGDSITVLHGGRSLLMDVETGRLERLSLPLGIGIDNASLSPWEENGSRQIVGVGWNQSGSGESSERSDIALVRLSLLDGAVLNRLTLSDKAFPAGPPCWVPDAQAAVIYAGVDFRLYRVDFDSSNLDDSFGNGADTHPRALTWRDPMFAASDVQVLDLAWPDDSRLGGRALATLRIKDHETGKFSDWEVWWLELDRRGASVVAAGRLLQPNPAATEVSTRLPNLVRAEDGAPALTYLLRIPGRSGYQLRYAPVRFDPVSGAPSALEVESRVLADGCLPVRPAVHSSGRLVTIVQPDGRGLRTARMGFPVAAESIPAETVNAPLAALGGASQRAPGSSRFGAGGCGGNRGYSSASSVLPAACSASLSMHWATSLRGRIARVAEK